MEQVRIPLEEVHSEHCATIVNNGLADLPGVESNRVEFANQEAVLEIDPEKFRYQDVVNRVRELGYQVTTIRKQVAVTGLSCASCAVSSENILSDEKGVVSVAVNFANTTANIEYIPTLTSLSVLKKALQTVGYDLIIDEEVDSDDYLEQRHLMQYRQLKRKVAGSFVLTLPVFIIGMFFMDLPWGDEIMWALSTPVLFWFGRDFFIRAWQLARKGMANMDTLVALSTGIAYGYSAFTVLFRGFWESRGVEAHVYFEAATVILFFILLGKLLEERAKGSTASAIKKLMKLQPKFVWTEDPSGNYVEKAVTEIEKGAMVMVKPGEKVALDGVVARGHSFVDESMISGEPIPVEKQKGNKVYAGTVNQNGSLFYEVEKVSSDTVLAQIVEMVKQAQGSKAPVQKLVDKIAGIFVPIVLLIALLTLLSWGIFGGDHGWTYGLMTMITVLVIACPCALGLATPTAIMVGIGKGAEKGILIKDALSLELAKKIDVVVFDKTGTLTEGSPKVVDDRWMDGVEDEVKAVMIAMEQQSEHPLARAVTGHYSGKRKDVDISSFKGVTGKGVEAESGGEIYRVGNEKWMKELGITLHAEFDGFIRDQYEKAATLLFFADSQKVVGVIAVSDPVKPHSALAVKELHDMGIETVLLTGDHQQTAKAIAATVGINSYYAGVLPEQKAAYVKDIQQTGKIVAMIGDGINDSAALAQADVSIAMGHGSDIAMDVAQITLMSSDLIKVPEAIRLSRQTVQTIRQNLFWAFIYNVTGIPVAAGVLFFWNGFLLNPMIAGAAMALSSVSVVANSLRLRLMK